MQPRQEIFDTYWRFAARRQEVFFRRIENAPPPWTSDFIINNYKFCNAYRASDRVSQYLIKHVIYQGSQDSSEVVFRTLLFKFFNKVETWQHLERALGEIRLSEFDFDRYSALLLEMQSEQPIYTSAYMSCADKAFGYNKKHENHLALLRYLMFDECITEKVQRAKSLEEVFSILRSYPLIGNFMGYQLATDLNYSNVIDFEENSFTIAGPGAERGIQKCFQNTGRKSNAYIIQWMVENQAREFERLELPFRSLWGRPLKAIDCQNLFCETDKYCRVAFPELKSNRKKIKAKFSANSSIIEYFYPPKWEINTKVMETLNLRQPDRPPLEPATQQLSLIS
jgi:hypothetical protein